MAENNTPTREDRFINALTEALLTFNDFAEEFAFRVDDGTTVAVEFFDPNHGFGEVETVLKADLSTLIVTKES